MDVLVEVHDAANWNARWRCGPLIGINNRNLHTFETSLETTYGLLPGFPAIAGGHRERHRHSPGRARHARRGVHAFLVGESFMRAPDPGRGAAVRLSLLSACRRPPWSCP
jgi:indole-3-glycerol phosphate synthase